MKPGSLAVVVQLPDFLVDAVQSKARRVIVIRRARKIDLEDDKKVAVKRRGRKSNVQKQAELALLDENEATKNWEYAVLVCDTPYRLEHMGQHYRGSR